MARHLEVLKTVMVARVMLEEEGSLLILERSSTTAWNLGMEHPLIVFMWRGGSNCLGLVRKKKTSCYERSVY